MEGLSEGTGVRGLQRGVGLLIFGTAALGAALLWWAVSDTRSGRSDPSDGIVFGVWHLLYDTEAPTLPTLAFAAGLALLFAAGVALLERRIANRARRSDDGDRLVRRIAEREGRDLDEVRQLSGAGVVDRGEGGDGRDHHGGTDAFDY